MVKYRYDPRIHWIPRGLEVTESLRRNLKCRDLFVYYNDWSQNWVVSLMWPDRRIEDLLVLGRVMPLMNAVTAPTFGEMDYLLNGPSVNLAKVWGGMEQDRLRNERDEDADELDAMRYLDRKSGTDFGWLKKR